MSIGGWWNVPDDGIVLVAIEDSINLTTYTSEGGFRWEPVLVSGHDYQN